MNFTQEVPRRSFLLIPSASVSKRIVFTATFYLIMRKLRKSMSKRWCIKTVNYRATCHSQVVHEGINYTIREL